MTRRSMLASSAPLAILPAAAATPAPAGPKRLVLDLVLGNGARGRLVIETGDPGDDQHQGALLRLALTTTLDGERLTAHFAVAETGRPDDPRGAWSRGPEGEEAGWDEMIGPGYLHLFMRPIA